MGENLKIRSGQKKEFSKFFNFFDPLKFFMTPVEVHTNWNTCGTMVQSNIPAHSINTDKANDTSKKWKAFSAGATIIFGIVLFVGVSLGGVERNSNIGFLRNSRSLEREDTQGIHSKSERYTSTLDTHEKSDRYRKIEESFTEELDKIVPVSEDISRQRGLTMPNLSDSNDYRSTAGDIHTKTSRYHRAFDMHDKADRYRRANEGNIKKMADTTSISEQVARKRGLTASLYSSMGINAAESDDYSASTKDIETKAGVASKTMDTHETPDRFHGIEKDFIQHKQDAVPVGERVARGRHLTSALSSNEGMDTDSSANGGARTQAVHIKTDRYRRTLDMHSKANRHHEFVDAPDKVVVPVGKEMERTRELENDGETVIGGEENNTSDIHSKTDRNRRNLDMHNKADRLRDSNKVTFKAIVDIVPVSEETTR